MEIVGIQTSIGVMYPDVFEGATTGSGVTTTVKFAVANGFYVSAVTFNVDTVVEAVNTSNPGVIDGPGESESLIQRDAGCERPVPSTGGVERVPVATATARTGTVFVFN